MKRPALKRLALLAGTLLLAATATAGIKGSYRTGDGQQMDLYYVGPQQIRVTLGPDAQLVVKQGRTWMLNRQGSQWMALDAAQMGGVMAAIGKQANVTQFEPGDISLKPLGRKETVAGFEGEVWELDDGKERHEVVLSNHADVRALTEGWRQIATRLAKQLGIDDVQKVDQALRALPDQQTGLLRQGNNLVLTGIDKNVSPADVDFPAGTQMMEIPKIPGLSGLPGLR